MSLCGHRPFLVSAVLLPPPASAVEEARAAQKTADNTVHFAQAREAAAVAAEKRATAKAAEARQTVWKLSGEERRRVYGGGQGGWDVGGAVDPPRETHLGGTAAAAALCRRVALIQERRKRVVSVNLNLRRGAIRLPNGCRHNCCLVPSSCDEFRCCSCACVAGAYLCLLP